MTRLLVVSHPCVTPVNQRLFGALERVTGWRITLAVPARWRNAYGTITEIERDPAFGGPIVPVPVWLPGNIPLHTYRSTFLRLLRQEGPDAIYLHHEPYAAATSQLYLANWLTLRRPIGFYAAQNIAKRYPLAIRLLERRVFRQSSFAFPVTGEALALLRRRGYRGPAEVLPLGVDPQSYSSREGVDSIRRQLQIRAGDLLVGYVGRLAEEKGLRTLIRAVSLLKDLPWHLILVGSGPLEHEIDVMARGLGIAQRVSRVGYVPHDRISAYFGAFDVLVLPSESRDGWKEQFGRVLIEALAGGTAVIGSDSGFIPEVIRSTGGGLIFPEGVPEALADRLRELLSDDAKRTRLAQSGRTNVLARYSQHGLAETMAAVIERAIRARLGSVR